MLNLPKRTYRTFWMQRTVWFMTRGPRLATVVALGFVSIVAATVWDLWFLIQKDPTQGWGRAALGAGFTVSAVLLFKEPGQRGNACLFAAFAAVWAVDQSGFRLTGVFARASMFTGGFTIVVGAAALLRYPRARLDRPSRYFVGAACVMAGLLQAGLLMTGAPPWDYLGQTQAPDDLIHQSAFDFVLKLKSSWWLLASAVFLILLGRRWRSLGGLERRAVMPIVAAAAVIAILLGASLFDPYLSEPVVRIRSILTWYSAAAVGLAFAASAIQLRLAQTGVTRLVNRLPSSPSVDSVREELRAILADHSLDILYWVPEQASFVSSDGIPEERFAATDRLIIDAPATNGDPLARIVTDPSLGRHRDLVAAALRVGRMALENARLEASLRAQLVAVQEARGRLLHAALEQRRQLERDLHDGAQQRLLAVGMQLGSIEATATDPTTVRAVQDAKTQLHVALEELRDLAHGLYPAVLSQAGLCAAIETVIEGLPLTVRLSVPTQRWHPDVEAAAYLVACEALVNVSKHSGSPTAALVVDVIDGELRMTISDEGTGSHRLQHDDALRHLRDRLAALGGTLHVTSSPGTGTQVVACIPVN